MPPSPTDARPPIAELRFGLQVRLDSDVVANAQAAEAAGFDVVTVADHIGGGLAPMVALGAVAQATSTIRLGTFVINAALQNPVQLAWDAASLDHLSGGRFELGLGAGHTPQEFAAVGITKESGRRRKQRLMETVEIVRRLVDGDTVTHLSEFFDLVDAAIDRSVQDRLPILVGGNGDALLRHAGAHADIIGLQGLGRTLEDGHRHSVDFSPDHLDAQVVSIREGAGSTVPELNALVQVVHIDDDSASVSDAKAGLLERVEGLEPQHLEATPYVMAGSVGEVAEKILACRERWGVSYFVVRDREAFAPVIARLRR